MKVANPEPHIAVEIETEGEGQETGDAKRGDVLVRWNSGATRDEFIDVSVNDTYSHARKSSSTAPSRALNTAAANKHRKYDEICRNRQAAFCAFILPADGGQIHAEAEDLLKRIAHSYPNKKGGTVKAWTTLLAIEITLEIIKGSSICCRWSRAKVKWLEHNPSDTLRDCLAFEKMVNARQSRKPALMAPSMDSNHLPEWLLVY